MARNSSIQIQQKLILSARKIKEMFKKPCTYAQKNQLNLFIVNYLYFFSKP